MPDKKARAAMLKALVRRVDNKIAYREGRIEMDRREIENLLGERERLADEFTALGDDDKDT